MARRKRKTKPAVENIQLKKALTPPSEEKDFGTIVVALLALVAAVAIYLIVRSNVFY